MLWVKTRATIGSNTGYGPHGVAVFVDAATDNDPYRGNVRAIFNKFSSNMGTMGSLSFLFDQKCVFTFKKKDGQHRHGRYDIGTDRLRVDDEFDEDRKKPGEITIYGDPKGFGDIQKYLEEMDRN